MRKKRKRSVRAVYHSLVPFNELILVDRPEMRNAQQSAKPRKNGSPN